MRKSWVWLFHFPFCFWGFPQMVCGQIESVLEKRAGIGVLHRGQRGLTGPVWGILSTACTIFAFFSFFPLCFFASSSFPMTNHTDLQKKTREPIFQLDVTLVNSYCDNFVRLFWKNVKREWLIKLFFLRRVKLVCERELKDMSVVLMTAERSNISAVALNKPLADMTGWGMNSIQSSGPDTYTLSKEYNCCSSSKPQKVSLQEISC